MMDKKAQAQIMSTVIKWIVVLAAAIIIIIIIGFAFGFINLKLDFIENLRF